MVDPTPRLEFYDLQRRRFHEANVRRTYNPACASCVAGRLHNDDTWKFHPDAGSGIIDGREMRNPK